VGIFYAPFLSILRRFFLSVKSGMGAPYDNAVAENFFSYLKCELVHLKQYPTRHAAQADIFTYLEIFYNTVRPHSALGWIAPAQFEALFHSSQSA
ncbi:hypothetical protein D7X33_16435, partial [Butyricicoccus sp. 1XD8-22]